MESKNVIDFFGSRENAVNALCSRNICKRSYAYRVLTLDIVPINIAIKIEQATKGVVKVETRKYYQR